MMDKALYQFRYPSMRAAIIDLLTEYDHFTIGDIEYLLEGEQIQDVTQGRIRTCLSRMVNEGLLYRVKQGVYSWATM